MRLDPTDAYLREADRLLVLYHASWCAASQAARRLFDELDAESALPFTIVDLSDREEPRWDAWRVRIVPTLAYLEKGEELERLEAERRRGLARADVERFVSYVESLTEEEKPRWMKPKQPTSRSLR